MQMNQNNKSQPNNKINQIQQQKYKNQNISTNQKWQKLVEQNEKQQQKMPFILKEQSFKSQNKNEQFTRQKQIMQQAANKGRNFLIQKNHLEASKQLSKALMAFQFIAKNHGLSVPKQQLKNIMIQTVLPAYSNLSLCYLKLQNYQMVVTLTNQVLAQDSDNIKARYRRALANKQLKNTEQAIKDFQLVRKVDVQMENDCNLKIKQCRNIEIEERKRRKLAAKKFISGYQSDDIKVNKAQQEKNNQNSSQQNVINNEEIDKKGWSIIQWIRQKCEKCSKIWKKIGPKGNQIKKEENKNK